MVDLLQAVAWLCMVSVGGMGVSVKDVRKAQVKCQKGYVQCLMKKAKAKNKLGTQPTALDLMECIAEQG